MTSVPVARRPVPWTVAEACSLGAAWTTGFVLLVLSWYQAAGSVDVERQVAWANAGVLGLIISGAGTAVWLLSGRRAVGSRRRRLRLDERVDAALARMPAGESPTSAVSGALVHGTGMVRFHRSTCPLVQGKPVRSTTRGAHERAGRSACGVCEP